MGDINETALFDKYRHHELSNNEKTIFEDNLKNDDSLKQKFDLHKTLVESIISLGNDQLMTDLNKMHDERNNQFKKRIGFYFFLGSLGIISFWLATLPKSSANNPSMPLTGKDNVSTVPVAIQKENKTPSDSTTIMDTIDNTRKPNKKQFTPVKTVAVKQKFARTEVGPKLIYTAEFVQEPQYMYFNKTVHLVGWSKLNTNLIDLRIHQNKLYLFFNNNYYRLKKTNEWTLAEEVKDTRNFGSLRRNTGKATKLTVLIHPLKIERSSKRLNLFTTDSLPTTQWYSLQGEQFVLNKKGSPDIKKGELMEYKNKIYLRVSTKMYLLDPDGNTHKFKSVIIDDWEGKKIIEFYVTPNYLNFEDIHSLQQSN